MKSRLGQIQRGVFRIQVAVGDEQLLLIAAQVHIIDGYFRDERDHGVAAIFDAGGEIGIGRLDRSTRAAEHIQLPAAVKAKLEEIGFGTGEGKGEAAGGGIDGAGPTGASAAGASCAARSTGPARSAGPPGGPRRAAAGARTAFDEIGA